jgi:hypothetical protein
VLQALVRADTHTVVPPLKTDPITVGPMATPIAPTDGPTNAKGAGVKAGSAGSAGSPGSAGKWPKGVAALAAGIGAAIASAATTLATEAEHLLIRLIRLSALIVSLRGRPGFNSARAHV